MRFLSALVHAKAFILPVGRLSVVCSSLERLQISEVSAINSASNVMLSSSMEESFKYADLVLLPVHPVASLCFTTHFKEQVLVEQAGQVYLGGSSSQEEQRGWISPGSISVVALEASLRFCTSIQAALKYKIFNEIYN